MRLKNTHESWTDPEIDKFLSKYKIQLKRISHYEDSFTAPMKWRCTRCGQIVEYQWKTVRFYWSKKKLPGCHLCGHKNKLNDPKQFNCTNILENMDDNAYRFIGLFFACGVTDRHHNISFASSRKDVINYIIKVLRVKPARFSSGYLILKNEALFNKMQQLCLISPDGKPMRQRIPEWIANSSHRFQQFLRGYLMARLTCSVYDVFEKSRSRATKKQSFLYWHYELRISGPEIVIQQIQTLFFKYVKAVSLNIRVDHGKSSIVCSNLTTCYELLTWFFTQEMLSLYGKTPKAYRLLEKIRSDTDRAKQYRGRLIAMSTKANALNQEHKFFTLEKMSEETGLSIGFLSQMSHGLIPSSVPNDVKRTALSKFRKKEHLRAKRYEQVKCIMKYHDVEPGTALSYARLTPDEMPALHPIVRLEKEPTS